MCEVIGLCWGSWRDRRIGPGAPVGLGGKTFRDCFSSSRYSGPYQPDDSEDATVNRIALWLCTFTLAVSVGAVLLLPFSILSNEILLCFPQNYYIQWLNGSLIHGLWNLVFLFSNLSLVFLMPFAYFFTESEGFAGSKKVSRH
ncbi:UNVERIFIED_CONTAM: hypothetical protein FKN15_074716 [Acipenser sinensis]